MFSGDDESQSLPIVPPDTQQCREVCERMSLSQLKELRNLLAEYSVDDGNKEDLPSVGGLQPGNSQDEDSISSSCMGPPSEITDSCYPSLGGDHAGEHDHINEFERECAPPVLSFENDACNSEKLEMCRHDFRFQDGNLRKPHFQRSLQIPSPWLGPLTSFETDVKIDTPNPKKNYKKFVKQQVLNISAVTYCLYTCSQNGFRVALRLL